MFQVPLEGKAFIMSKKHGTTEAARVIVFAADIVAVVLGLWILMFVLDANRGNDLVKWVHQAADWLSVWSRDLFTPAAGWLRTLLNYGIAAVVYLVAGHAIAARIRRL